MMIVTITAPELVLSIAFGDWRWARASVSEMKNLGFGQDRWTMARAYFANMGGLKIVAREDTPIRPSVAEAKSTFTPKIGHIEPGTASLEDFSGETEWQRTICATQMAALTRPPFALQIPNLPEEEVNDKSKGDALAKSIACIQASWLLLQCFARAGQGLTVSPLELATADFVGCTLVTYIFWWHKPLRVEFAVSIDVPEKSYHDTVEILNGFGISSYRQNIQMAS